MPRSAQSQHDRRRRTDLHRKNRDEIVPLVEVLPADFVEELYLGLMASD